MSELIKHATDASFDADVLQSSTPVLVDFWAPWCAPCRGIAPILDTLATELAGKLQIVKVNVDENHNTPAQFGIRSIPSLLLFKNGQLVGTQVGMVDKQTLLDFLSSHQV